MSAFSFVQYPISSTTTGPFTVSFPYIAQYQVEVRKNGVLLATSAYTWPTSSTIQLVAAAVNGDTVEIRRNSMVKDDGTQGRLVDWSNSAKITELNLDKADLQCFYLAQEAFDSAANALQLASDNTFDALNKRIKNVANPASLQDAATKSYVDTTVTGAALGTIPGDITVAKVTPLLNLNETAAGFGGMIRWLKGGVAKWTLRSESNILDNFILYAGDASGPIAFLIDRATRIFRFVGLSGGRSAYIHPEAPAGYNNGLTGPNDALITSDSSAINLASMSIGPWNDRPGGLGMRIDGPSKTVLLAGDNLNFAGNVNIPTFATINAVKAWNGRTDKTIVFVKGYTADGDGGGGLFYFDAASAVAINDATVFAPTLGSGRWFRLYSGMVNVKWWGAKGDGVTNDTNAMTNAHATGKVVYYPAGVYNFTALSFAEGGIVGDGRGQTILSNTVTSSADAITCTGNAYFYEFRDFQLAGPAGKVGGFGLRINPASGENKFASIDRVCFNQWPGCLSFDRAAFWTVRNCFFQTFGTGLLIDNATNPDGGDQVLDGNVFSTDTGLWPTAICVHYKKGGGLKAYGNKLLSGQYGFLMLCDGNTNTSILEIVGNSIENQTFAAISLQKASGTITWQSIVIANNHCVAPNCINAGSANTFLNTMSITGNVLVLGPSHIGIDLDRIDGFNVSGNVITGSNSGDIGIRIGTNCTDGKIGANTYNNVAITLSNSSTTTMHQKDQQTGTSSGTTNAAYGTLFNTPVVTVNFATPFTIAPGLGDVTANVTDGTGGGIAVMCTAVSTTQAQFICIGLNNTAVINFRWSVWGVK